MAIEVNSVDSTLSARITHCMSNFWQKVLMIMAALGTAWIFILMFVVCADVIGRAVFSQPIHGVGTFAGFSIIGIVFLQLPEALHSGRLTRSDFLLVLVDRRLPRLRWAIEAVFCVVGALVFGLCAKVSVPTLERAWKTAEQAGVEGLFTFPTWPFRFLIVFGMLLCCLESARQLVRCAQNAVDNRGDDK